MVMRLVAVDHAVHLGDAASNDGDPDHADGEDAEGAQKDLEPVVAHSFTPGEPGPSIDRAPGLARRPGRSNVSTRDAIRPGKVSVIEVEGLQKVYGDLRGGPGPDLPGGARRGGRPGRAQRGRQDHHPPLPRRDHDPDPWADPDRGPRPRDRPGGGQVGAGVRPRRAASLRISHGRGAPALRGPTLSGGGRRSASPRRARASWSWRTERTLPPGGALPGHEAEARDRLRPDPRPRAPSCWTSRSPGSTRSASAA